MQRTTRFALAVSAAGTILLGVGCSGAAPPPAAGTSVAPTSAATPGADAIAWTDKVCGSLKGLADAVNQKPALDTATPQATAKSLADLLTRFVAATETAITDIKAAGPSPIPAGDAAAAKLTDVLTSYRTNFDKAKANLAAADPTDTAAIQAALKPVYDLQNGPSPASEFESNPELRQAVSQAPNCQALQKPAG